MSTSTLKHEPKTVLQTLKPLICYFTFLELMIVFVILKMPETMLYKELYVFGILDTWPTSILVGCCFVYAGAFIKKQIRHIPPLISTGQALNAIAWSVIGFIHLNTPLDGAGGGFEVAYGLFVLAITNVVMAIWIELHGHKII